MPSINHVHTYIRVKGQNPTSPNAQYMCADPHCSHRISAMYLVGKASKCWSCGNEFILKPREHLRMAKPHCGCLKGQSGKGAPAAIKDEPQVPTGIEAKILEAAGLGEDEE